MMLEAIRYRLFCRFFYHSVRQGVICPLPGHMLQHAGRIAHLAFSDRNRKYLLASCMDIRRRCTSTLPGRSHYKQPLRHHFFVLQANATSSLQVAPYGQCGGLGAGCFGGQCGVSLSPRMPHSCLLEVHVEAPSSSCAYSSHHCPSPSIWAL